MQHGIYLEISGHDRLPVILDLLELGSQPLHLVLHLDDVLEIPLSPEVQHLDGLGHVLDLREHDRQSSSSKRGSSLTQSL